MALNIVVFCFAFYSTAANAMEHLVSIGFRVGYADLKRKNHSGRQKENEISQQQQQQQRQPIGVCKYCGSQADRNCARCGEFYCTLGCQKNDWLSHKQNCFPMPELIQSSLHSSHSEEESTRNI